MSASVPQGGETNENPNEGVPHWQMVEIYDNLNTLRLTYEQLEGTSLEKERALRALLRAALSNPNVPWLSIDGVPVHCKEWYVLYYMKNMYNHEYQNIQHGPRGVERKTTLIFCFAFLVNELTGARGFNQDLKEHFALHFIKIHNNFWAETSSRFNSAPRSLEQLDLEDVHQFLIMMGPWLADGMDNVRGIRFGRKLVDWCGKNNIPELCRDSQTVLRAVRAGGSADHMAEFRRIFVSGTVVSFILGALR